MADASNHVQSTDRSDRGNIGIAPPVVRTATGEVERQRMIVVIDVIPEGRDYRLEVATKLMPAALIPETTALEQLDRYNL